MTLHVNTPSADSPAPRKRQTHTRPATLTISLHQPGRLRVAHVLALLGISHSTLYAGLKIGRYPAFDGRDGKMPFWNTDTIRNFLQPKS